MSNKHFCQGPDCHTRITQDRFLKSRGVIRGRYAATPLDHDNAYYKRGKYFCSTACEYTWLDAHMESIEQGRPIEFIRHRRESGGYQKETFTHTDYFGKPYTRTQIKRVDNRTEVD
jgi:hypothetical protein